MATKKQALQAIQEEGGVIDWGVSEITKTDKSICIDAPGTDYWSSSDAPSIVINWYSGPASEFWDEVIDRVSEGSYDYYGA